MTWLLVLAGLAIAVAGIGAVLAQAASGAQPWSNELSDNFVFLKALPFVLGLGVVVGMLMARSYGAKRRADGAMRRFSPGTVFGHWVLTAGFLLALPTGMWQYLGGILDVNLPVPLYSIYRLHYIGAVIVLFAVTAFVSYFWMTGDRSLLVPRREWARHLVGLALELPQPLRGWLASLLRLDLGRRPDGSGRFTYYEKAEFPVWAFALGLITITGLVKVLRYAVPVPGVVVFMVSTLHVTAMVLIVILVLDHLRYTFARWPLMVAMTTTWIKEGSNATPAVTAERTGSAAAGVAGGSDS